MLSIQEVLSMSTGEAIKYTPMMLDGLPKDTRSKMGTLLHAAFWADYYVAPASRSHHHAYEGGLIKHSVEVAVIAQHLAQTLIGVGHSLTNSCIVVGLIHDMGKMFLYQKTNEGYVHKEKSSINFSYPVPVASLVFATEYAELTPDEIFAILCHDGMYAPENQQSLPGNETPLQMVIHWADMWSSRHKE